MSLANWQVRKWFEKEKNSRQIDKQILVKPLTVMTIGDLEKLATYLNAGDFILKDFIEFYTDSLDKVWFHPMKHFDNIFKNLQSLKIAIFDDYSLFYPFRSASFDFNYYKAIIR